MEREKAVKTLNDMIGDYHYNGVRYTTKIEALEYAIKSLSRVGYWEEKYLKDEPPLFRRRFYCSACGNWNTYGKPKYCPDCGARMEQI